jgi:hypothetical protein
VILLPLLPKYWVYRCEPSCLPVLFSGTFTFTFAHRLQ